MDPGSAAHREGALLIRGTMSRRFQAFNSSYKSRQFTLNFSIRSIFQARRQRFSKCSRDRASRIDSNLEIDEEMDVVLAREAWNELGLMFC
jgi:hypothetical protein